MNRAPAILEINQPRTLVFGRGCARRAGETACKSAFIVTAQATRRLAEPVAAAIKGTVLIWDRVNREPTVKDVEDALAAARQAGADHVIGLGGGSAMDVAKVVAALIPSPKRVEEVLGIGNLPRAVYCACVPTTAGTGSEVSPNAIFLDEASGQKKAVISPHLVPDAAYVDPELTLSVPPAVTAATGMDALTHCIEAFANNFSHTMIDVYAIEGVRRISGSLQAAVENGADIQARTNLALGSMYGGMCLGPVNTGAVHALAYPLQSLFKIAHGVANAVLLAAVLEFNRPAAPERYGQIAQAMGERDAESGVEFIRRLCRQCGIPAGIGQLGIPESAIRSMADSAMTVTRLLERNVRPVTLADAMEIYRRAF